MKRYPVAGPGDMELAPPVMYDWSKQLPHSSATFGDLYPNTMYDWMIAARQRQVQQLAAQRLRYHDAQMNPTRPVPTVAPWVIKMLANTARTAHPRSLVVREDYTPYGTPWGP